MTIRVIRLIGPREITLKEVVIACAKRPHPDLFPRRGSALFLKVLSFVENLGEAIIRMLFKRDFP
ncbi:hypothetical protein LX99_01752 [Mucilaginibacter oryzae]|uniref:Uncharacterized protein n=1 Tax=Mucilaginibacter oryzae TaxID=468058 RepID=A0A316HM64_9SPHI|nr:hypothetical protein LX99_01752 [Mucilaginibacter oryzae]